MWDPQVMASTRDSDLRSWVRRATTETGAVQRARETAGISRTDAARRLHVDTVTYYRWELGQRTPTHGANLANFARFAKRIGVDEDPAMRDCTAIAGESQDARDREFA